MNSREPAHILMVYPPPAALTAPPPQMTCLVRQPASRRLPFKQYDANLDFFVRYLLDPENLQRFLAVIETNRAHGVYQAADANTRWLLDDLAENRPQWEKRIARAGRYLAVCRTEDFYRPENSVRALGNAAALMKLASLAFYPSKIGWGAFVPPRDGVMDGHRFFLQDAAANPFREQCIAGLAPKLDTPGLRLLLFWISAKGQLPAIATMADFSKKTSPALPVAVTGPPGLLADCKPVVDRLLAVPEDQLFSRLKQFIGGGDTGQPEAGPDFSRFPRGLYLSPAPVLSVDLRPGGIQVGTPAELSELIAAGEAELGAEGVFIKADDGLARHISGMTRLNSGKKPAGGLGICTNLRETCREIDEKILRLAGVSLIVWRAPKGSLEALKAVLWQMSRAGIWNHLRVPNECADTLIQALIAFAAANPNIVHSWDYPGSFAAPVDHAPGSEEPTVYRRVKKLPGRPLWQILNDPVHLMLYLQRYGRQQVMRWRVSDNRDGVYTLGSALEYHFVKPAELSRGYLDEICLMVADGGSVNMERVRDNLENAFLIAYVMEGGVIVGNSSLKNPRPAYIKTVNRQSGLDLTHFVERGYTSVRPEYRGMGIGARLLAGLTKRAGDRKVFSVIGADNAAARKMAIRNRTRQVAEYYSERLKKRVGIWIPEWMLD